MPSTIPYDPQLTLANIVSEEALKNVELIAKEQAPVDAEQDELNSLLSSRRSLDMTRTELQQLGIPIKNLNDSIDTLNKDIETVAAKYADLKITAEGKIKDLRAKISAVHSKQESPVDFVKTEIKSLPLASDSINMDVQYFSLDTNAEDSSAYASTIASYVSNSTSFLGTTVSRQMSSSAAHQVANQVSKHNIAGTLVISVSCTHKNATVLAPFVLNVDKGIKVWNHLFPGDKILPTSTKNMLEIASKDDPDGANRFSIISGMTYGSSFVGMVHILNTTSTSASESMTSMVASLQAQMDAGGWLAKASGGFGVNASIANDVKNLLSSQNITSHVTMICMGVIPSLVASDVKLGVAKFAQFDPKSTMESIATLQNATVAGQDTVKQSADAARTGQQMVSMKAGEIKAALEALAVIDDGNNKVLDINSLMTAFEDYLKKAAEGTSGVPINYYLKDITKSMLAEMWVSKYYPGRYLSIKYDDSEGGDTPPAPGPSPPPADHIRYQ
ncbi:hypothetical protein QBC35DRAFT_534420 [Podospora australis]|uniref:Uncharacterized protein n=1 Tax=Podospora australis TaxID=1536484 RepID=A0AAN6WNK4_9PEZI|nr:hypothetical protein QBC35DRAFT_534420 [Podospora australis]